MSVVINITNAPEQVDINVNDTIEQVDITISQGGGGGADPATQAEVDAGVIANKYVAPLTFENAAKWSTKFDNPSGAASDYLDGTGAPQPFPTIPAQLTAGTDISIVGNAINNTAPDQVVSLNGGSGIGVSGAYPNFTISNTAPSDIIKAVANGTDSYTATIAGVTSYTDGDVYLIRFTNGNTTGATLNINSIGAQTLYRNNDGALIGGDIWAGAEMLCVYNSIINGFQAIGTSPNSLYAYVTNAEAVAITKGQVVYSFGAQGDRLTVKLANNTSDATSARTLGVVYSDSIGANQKGFILIQGEIHNLNILPTSTWADGDIVYLGATAGSITKTKPYAPNHLVYVATVITASNGNAGRMYVRVQNGYELDELHDVSAQTPANNDGLFYNSTTGLWTARAGTKSDVGLGNVDNTSDANKPISSATQTALNAKQNTLVSGTNIKSVNNQSLVGSGNINIGYSSSQVGSWAHVGNTTMTKVLTLPAVPSNTFAANDHITIKIAAVSGTANASNRIAVYVNTSDSLTGAILVAHFLSNGSTTHTVGERTMFIQVSNGSGVGTFAWTTTLFVQTDNNTVTPAFTTMAIDWTQQQFFIIALQNGTTVLTQTVRAFGIQKR